MFCDTETFSTTDISAGTDRYTRDATCLIVTYALDDGPVKIWQPWRDPLHPADLMQAVQDSSVIFVAHNSAFDRLVFSRCLGINISVARFRCTMAAASAHGLPGSLEALGKVCGLTEDEGKLVDDKALIQTFCCPQGTGQRILPTDQPDNWQKFCAYAIRDTEALRTIFNRMPQANYAGVNLRSWMLD